MRGSIVIASYNEGDLLTKTVRSCLETTGGFDCEIVVADDASQDGSFDELRRRCGGDVRVVTQPSRRGVAPTKDLAARSANGDVIVFLDAHCKPEAGAIEQLVRDVEDWQGAAIVTPRIADLDVDRWQCRPDFVGYGVWTDLEWFQHSWLPLEDMTPVAGPGGREFYRSPSLIGGCAAMSRALYEDLGGFDVGMRSHGSEDVDFGLVAWLAGHEVLLDPAPLIGHQFRRDFDTYVVPEEHALLNQIRMARRNFGDAAWQDWTGRHAGMHPADRWRGAWAAFEEGRAALERDRDRILARRIRDEYWYAAEFNLAWPLTLPNSPYPPSATPRRSPLANPAPAGRAASPPTASPTDIRGGVD